MMPARNRAIPLVGFIAVLIGIVLFPNRQNPSAAAGSSPSQGSGATNLASLESKTHENTARSKTRPRLPQEEPDFGATFDNLQVTIPGLTEFPEQTLQERILATNALLKEHDIALRFGVDEILYPSNHLLDLKVPAFSRQDARPGDILRHDVTAMDKHYFISGDKVLYQDGSGG